jgi:putative DNA primase/helicase
VGKYNFPQLRKEADIVYIIQKYGDIKLKQDPGSPYYKSKCPFHNEDSASFVVTPGKHIWKCFGCGKSGDVFDFLKDINYSLEDAIKIVQGETPSVVNNIERKEGKEPALIVWKQITPDRWPQKFVHERYGEPIAVWPYHNKDGTIASYDCRFEYNDSETGKLRKDVLPITFMTNGERSEWRWHAMSVKRMLSNLHLISSDKERAIVIVEGKKTAAAAERLLKRPIVTTWQGGSNAIQQTDWSPLYGRDVIIWQDHDYPGYKASIDIADILRPHGTKIKFVHNPPEKEKGWDAADAEAEGWTAEQTRKFILLYQDTPQVISNIKLNEKEPEPQPEVIDVQERPIEHVHNNAEKFSENDNNIEAIEAIQIPFDNADVFLPEENVSGELAPVEDNKRHRHFLFLGFESKDGKINHCFYQLTKRVIIKLSASSIGKAAPLLELAPLDYWEREFPSKSDGGNFNLVAAANFLINISGQLPIFKGANIRGRGVWMDGTHSVVHNGDCLIVDGVHTDLGGLDSKYVYEQNTSFGLDASRPLDAHASFKFLELCNLLKWERPVNGYLLAGWCIIAPVCGALKWRPHIWLTGGAGSGKSWVLDNIIKPSLGVIALCVQGATSEAGIRQSLKQDARPVIFDEAEGENMKDSDRMQSVLSLMRAASSEDGGNIIKGSSQSGAESFQIRSCFAYASIGMQLSQQSDRSRVSVLGMRGEGFTDAEKKISKDHFANLIEKQFSLITPEYCQQLQARTIKLLPVIIKNAKTFSAAGAIVLGSQRAGDQLGALLAGAWSLRSDLDVSLQDAIDWLKLQDWSEETSLQETRDEYNLFACIMEHIVSVEGEMTKWDRSIGELVRIVAGLEADNHQTLSNSITHYSALSRLKRSGIVVEGDWILISNTDSSIKNILKNTPWSKNHSNLLIRIPGAKKIENPIRFGSGTQSRVVAIPMSYFTGEK